MAQENTETGQEETGTVRWFDARKQYGFIERDGGGDDIFVHTIGMADPHTHSLTAGERVCFIVHEGLLRPEAQGVRRLF